MSSQRVVTVDIMGGLGNQLFQIFACMAYGLRTDRKIIFPFFDDQYNERINVLRVTYWDTLLKTIKHFTTLNCTENELKDFSVRFKYIEPGFKFTPIPSCPANHLLLHGYFQSYKYFEEHYDTICSLINFPTQVLMVKNTYPQYFNENVRTISMHFRLGDYVRLQDIHPLMPVEYYVQALRYVLIRQNGASCNVLYFCEEHDISMVSVMIQQIQILVKGVTFVRIDPSISDWEQMLLMANCHDNIIANSTFSWWGAYLNQTPKKIVCYPSKWFGPRAKHNTSDLFPDKWQSIVW
jgi:hypothetical protein